MQTGLDEKVVLVTGGAGGIGEEICKAFASEGSKVIVHYHSSSENATKIADEIQGFSIKADLTESSETKLMFEKIIEKW